MPYKNDLCTVKADCEIGAGMRLRSLAPKANGFTFVLRRNFHLPAVVFGS